VLCPHYTNNEILHSKDSFVLMLKLFLKCVGTLLNVRKLWFDSALGMKCSTLQWSAMLNPHYIDNEILHSKSSFVCMFEFFLWKCVGVLLDVRELWFCTTLSKSPYMTSKVSLCMCIQSTCCGISKATMCSSSKQRT
jgi:hypothetical protein